MEATDMNMKRFSMVVGVFLALATGCAAMRAAAARQTYINNQTSGHVYNQPVGQVWPAARQLLFEAGYQVKDTGEAGALTLETDWLAGQNDQSSRVLVQGIAVDDTHAKVQFTRLTRRTNMQPESSRALDLEWELIQRADPDSATQIQAQAEQKGQAARNQ
jgi:hypothetical protein